MTGSLACVAVVPTVAQASRPAGAYSTAGSWRFVSAPQLHPPRLLVERRRQGVPAGDFLVDTLPNTSDARPMTGEGGPLILDSRLRPVWVHGVGSRLVSTNLQQESYLGKPVLVWWQGLLTGPPWRFSDRRVVVVDSHYRRVAVLRSSPPWAIDPHDAWIDGNRIWITVGRFVRREDLTSYGGASRATVYDVGVQEYDLQTGRVLYTWDALNPGGRPHVSLAQSETPPPRQLGGGWDPYHINSVQVLSDGRVLISMRNTWAVYLIDPRSGRTVWTLGGKSSGFGFGPGSRFAWQHDARLIDAGADSGVGRNVELTLFNDNCCPNGDLGTALGPSDGLILRLNTVIRHASLISAYGHTPPLHTPFQGSMQLQPEGGAVVGWATSFSEYSGSGKDLLDVTWPGKDASYRVLRTTTWVGTPYYPPQGAVRTVGARTTVYASWNGATDVARWEILGGTSRASLRSVASRSRTGFQTSIPLTRSYPTYEVRAIDARGRALRTSAAFSG